MLLGGHSLSSSQSSRLARKWLRVHIIELVRPTAIVCYNAIVNSCHVSRLALMLGRWKWHRIGLSVNERLITSLQFVGLSILRARTMSRIRLDRCMMHGSLPAAVEYGRCSFGWQQGCPVCCSCAALSDFLMTRSSLLHRRMLCLIDVSYATSATIRSNCDARRERGARFPYGKGGGPARSRHACGANPSSVKPRPFVDERRLAELDRSLPTAQLGGRFDIPGTDAFLHTHMEHQSFADREDVHLMVDRNQRRVLHRQPRRLAI